LGPIEIQSIFAAEPQARALYREILEYGLSHPTHYNDPDFQRLFKARLERIVGWDASNPDLSGADAYERFYLSCTDAINCFVAWKDLQAVGQADSYKPGWAFHRFVNKFGVAPKFRFPNQKFANSRRG
jgi:hypothetical protein